MSKKKAGRREGKGKSSKTAQRARASELSEAQLDRVAGGVDSFAGIKGEASKDGHKEQIEIQSWSFGAQPPPDGLKSR